MTLSEVRHSSFLHLRGNGKFERLISLIKRMILYCMSRIYPMWITKTSLKGLRTWQDAESLVCDQDRGTQFTICRSESTYVYMIDKNINSSRGAAYDLWKDDAAKTVRICFRQHFIEQETLCSMLQYKKWAWGERWVRCSLNDNSLHGGKSCMVESVMFSTFPSQYCGCHVFSFIWYCMIFFRLMTSPRSIL